jgi:hypothetical protein
METRKEVSKLQAVQLGFSSGTPVEHVNIYDHLTPRLQTLLYEAKQFRQANNYQGRIQTGLTGLYKPVRFSKERKSITFHIYN